MDCSNKHRNIPLVSNFCLDKEHISATLKWQQGGSFMRYLLLIPIFFILISMKCSGGNDVTGDDDPIPPTPTNVIFPHTEGSTWTYQKFDYVNTEPARWVADSEFAVQTSYVTKDNWYTIYAHEENGIHVEESVTGFEFIDALDNKLTKFFAVESDGIYEYFQVSDTDAYIWSNRKMLLSLPYTLGDTWEYEGFSSYTATWLAPIVIQTLDNPLPLTCYAFSRTDVPNRIYLYANGIGPVGYIDLATDGTGEPLTNYKSKVLLKEHSFASY